MKSRAINEVVFALRRQGLEVLEVKDSERLFPRIVIQKPTEEILQKAVEFHINDRGVKRIERVYLIGNCSVVWH